MEDLIRNTRATDVLWLVIIRISLCVSTHEDCCYWEEGCLTVCPIPSNPSCQSHTGKCLCKEHPWTPLTLVCTLQRVWHCQSESHERGHSRIITALLGTWGGTKRSRGTQNPHSSLPLPWVCLQGGEPWSPAGRLLPLCSERRRSQGQHSLPFHRRAIPAAPAKELSWGSWAGAGVQHQRDGESSAWTQPQEPPGVARAETWAPAPRGTNRAQRGDSGCWVQSPAAGSKHILGLCQVRLKTASGHWVSFWLCTPAALLELLPSLFSGVGLLRPGQGSAAMVWCCVLIHRNNAYTEYSSNSTCVGHRSASSLLARQWSKQTPKWVAHMPRMEPVFHVQLLTDALLSIAGPKTCYNKELYKTQRCESCSRVLVPCAQVSRDTQL